MEELREFMDSHEVQKNYVISHKEECNNGTSYYYIDDRIYSQYY